MAHIRLFAITRSGGQRPLADHQQGFHLAMSILIGPGPQDGGGMQGSNGGRESFGFLNLPMRLCSLRSRAQQGLRCNRAKTGL